MVILETFICLLVLSLPLCSSLTCFVKPALTLQTLVWFQPQTQQLTCKFNNPKSLLQAATKKKTPTKKAATKAKTSTATKKKTPAKKAAGAKTAPAKKAATKKAAPKTKAAPAAATAAA